MLRLSLTEFSLPKFYLLFGISKVKSAAVIAFRSSYRDRSFSPGSYERETFALSSLETVTEALLEIMEVCVCVLQSHKYHQACRSPCLSSAVMINRSAYCRLLSLIFHYLISSPGVHEGHPRLQVARPVDRAGAEVWMAS